MTDFAHEHVIKFYSLYVSERREIAEWLGVSKDSAEEPDLQYAKRILFAAKDADKVHDLVDRIEGFLAKRPPERATLRNPPADGSGQNIFRLHRRRESVTADEVLKWIKEQPTDSGWLATIKGIELALDEICQ